jgi:regulator of sirC expression with transglutaminase-like and TPR domain
VKQALGPQAELSVTYFEPADNRSLLVRLQNIVKTRQIEAEDYEAALQTVTAMRAVDPHEYRLLLDQGVLCARLDMAPVAIAALEAYIEKAPSDRDRHEAAMLLQQLKQALG